LVLNAKTSFTVQFKVPRGVAFNAFIAAETTQTVVSARSSITINNPYTMFNGATTPNIMAPALVPPSCLVLTMTPGFPASVALNLRTIIQNQVAAGGNPGCLSVQDDSNNFEPGYTPVVIPCKNTTISSSAVVSSTNASAANTSTSTGSLRFLATTNSTQLISYCFIPSAECPNDYSGTVISGLAPVGKPTPLSTILMPMNPAYTSLIAATALTAQNTPTIFNALTLASNVMFGFFVTATGQTPQSTDMATAILLNSLGLYINSPTPIMCQMMILNGALQNTTTVSTATFGNCNSGNGTCFNLSLPGAAANVTINSTNIMNMTGQANWTSFFPSTTGASYAIYSTCRLPINADSIWSAPSLMWFNIPAQTAPISSVTTSSAAAPTALTSCPTGQGINTTNANLTCYTCPSGVVNAGATGYPATCSTGKLLSSLIMLFVLILAFL